MDESPEELARIRAEAEQIDPYKYRRRTRAMAAIGLGALSAGLVWVVLEFTDKARNPCERVRDHFCAIDPKSTECEMRTTILQDSVDHPNPEMRSNIRGDCEKKIERMKRDDGIQVR